jgi:hypothetical protein
MMGIEPLCAYLETDVPSQYVAARLPDEEAAAFEEHYFACARCWEEVRVGSGVSRVLGARALVRPARWRTAMLAAAAAVTIAFLATVAPRLMREDADVLRGPESAIELRLSSSAGRVHASWAAVERAARYDVVVQNDEGEVLTRVSVREARAAFAQPRETAFVTVSALDPDGEEIARSHPVRAPAQ